MIKMQPIDTRAFNAAMQQLATLGGAPLHDVVLHEAKEIIADVVARTPVAKQEDIIGNVGSGKAFTTDIGRGRKTYWMENRYSTAVWSKLVTARAAALKRKLTARGLAKQSWYLLARRLGIELGVPGFVRSARPSTGETYPENTATRRIESRDGFGIWASNGQPTAVALGGKNLLRAAINRRHRYFRKALASGALLQIKGVAKAYPGLIAHE